MTMLTAEQRKRHEELRLLKKRIRDQYLGRNGVIGMSVGFKSVGGTETDDLVIRFHVRRKAPVSKENAVPTEIEGVKTDVVETNICLHSSIDQYPPADPIEADYGPPERDFYNQLVGGISIGAGRKGINPIGGTLGLIVTDIATGAPMILSNFHVLCVNDGKDAKGDKICQPARADNRGLCSKCATLERWAAGSFLVDGEFYGMDAAVARIPKTLFGYVRKFSSRSVREVGEVTFTDTLTLELKMEVKKCGRTTGLTSGKINTVNLDIDHDFGGVIGKQRLYDQIEVAPKIDAQTTQENPVFGASGDSGAVILVESQLGSEKLVEVVGLNWGGEVVGGQTTGFSYGSPIGPILKQLAVRI
jgi:hypothetical protein